MNAFQAKFRDKLVVIGLSDESEAKVKGLQEPPIQYASAIDPQGRMKKTVAVTGIPHALLLDPDGIVRWEGFPLLEGYELTAKVIAEIIAKHSK